MEWIFLAALLVTFVAGIAALMLIMFLFPITRWIILGLAVSAVVATLLLIGGEEIGGATMEWWMWFLVSIAVVLVFSIRIIGPTETGIVVRLGAPVGVLRSGLRFRPRFIYRIVRYPTSQYKLDFSKREVITKRDVYKKYDDITEKWVAVELEADEIRKYEAAKILVDITLYFRWPTAKDITEIKDGDGNVVDRVSSLILAYRSAPPPEFAAVLKEFFEAAVISRMRAIIGDMTWRAAIENRDWIRDQVTTKLKEEEASPLHEASITKMSVVIEEIMLPEALEKTITLPQEEEYRKRGMMERAKGQRILIEEQARGYQGVGAWGPIAPFFALLDRLFGRTRIPGENSK